MNPGYRSKIEHAAKLIRKSNTTIALTGAGISTPSGIPDFRSAGSGLWEKFNAMEVASLSAFRYRPQDFFEWVRPLARKIVEADPNSAHYALARLEQAGQLAGIVTQNIDDLHGRAGSENVYEIHGHLREATCIRCYRRYPSERRIERFVETGKLPRCEECGGLLKPEVVLFGEQLPYLIVQDAKSLISQADLIIVAGSSLEVTPAAVFPVQALNTGASMIMINQDPTYLDDRAAVIFRDNVAKVLPDLAEEVLDG
ncbi:MAG: SIR2 family NAD-dependent protein deacylase [Anaerolineales bacterium]